MYEKGPGKGSQNEKPFGENPCGPKGWATSADVGSKKGSKGK
jgi:hypothetical protein